MLRGHGRLPVAASGRDTIVRKAQPSSVRLSTQERGDLQHVLIGPGGALGRTVLDALEAWFLPLGRLDRYRFLEGVTVGNLTPVIYCRNDLSGALDRGLDGRNTNSCVPGGELQRREAIKLGINLLMYSLTANYKKDQAHVRQLILEGRIE